MAGKLNLAFTRASDFVARYGGEEFAVLSSEQTSVQAGQFADALCGRIRDLRIGTEARQRPWNESGLPPRDARQARQNRQP